MTILTGQKARLAIFCASAGTLLILLSSSTSSSRGAFHPWQWIDEYNSDNVDKVDTSTFEPLKNGDLLLPDIYQAYSFVEEEPGTCAQEYGAQYIRDFSSTATSMCDSNSPSTMTCFARKTWENKTDQFCFANNIDIDPKAAEHPVSMGCKRRDFTKEEQEKGVVRPLNEIQVEWYNTGLRYLFEKYVKLKDSIAKPPTSADGNDRVVLLLKREDGNVIGNAWHVLMQMMSMWLSLDVLQSTINPATGKPFYSDADFKNTQVIIMDDNGDGPFSEMWNMFGGMGTTRLRYAQPLKAGRIVLPISGATQPLWQSRSNPINCSESILLRSFVHRILNFYDVPTVMPERTTMTLTYIERNRYRQLANKTSHLNALRTRLDQKYPHIKLEVIDFADMTFRDQIMKARTTDILVGMHGAGLTHTLFLPQGGTVVEIQPPGLEFYGFETLARFLGHGYFQEYGHKQEYEGMTHSWQADDIFITEQNFLWAIEHAIQVREWRDDEKERRLGYKAGKSHD